MDTLQILQAINDRKIDACFYTGPAYVFGAEWKITLSHKSGSTRVETTERGNSFNETLHRAWQNITQGIAT